MAEPFLFKLGSSWHSNHLAKSGYSINVKLNFPNLVNGYIKMILLFLYYY